MWGGVALAASPILNVVTKGPAPNDGATPLLRAATDLADSTDTVVERSPASQSPAVRASLPDAEIGRSVGRYIVIDEAGRGGMGRVLRAYDPKLQREVALKEMRAGALDKEAQQRLVVEARAMAKLSHPNVVSVYDVDALTDGRLVLVMEYVDGPTLRAWLRKTKRPWREIVERFCGAARGLAAAHRAGLLHRDFKPANVLLAGTAVKVTDFGLAKVDRAAEVRAPSKRARDRNDDTMTEAGIVLGTPRYMAPEQHRGEELTAAADQYALCVALWEALAGTPPFKGDDLLAAKVEGPPALARGEVPGSISDAILRGLAVVPAERFGSLDSLIEALELDPARRRRQWLVAGGLIGLGGALVASVAMRDTSESQACTGAQDEIAGVWNDARRADVRKAILAVQTPYADDAWSTAESQLTHYAEGWVEAHDDACEATSVRGEQSSEVMDLRMACLQRAKLELAAVTNVLSVADIETVRNVATVIGGLPPVAACADVAALQQEVAPPRPEEAPAVDEARELLAEVRAELRAGQFASAEAKMPAVETLVEDLRYGPIHAEILREKGDLLECLGRFEAAEEALRGALQRGIEARQWPTVQNTATMLVFLLANRLSRPKEALQYRELALGLADTPLREAWARNGLAVTYNELGRFEESVEQHRQTLALRQAALGEVHHLTAQSHNNLSTVLGRMGRHQEAEQEIRTAIAIREETLGPSHPHVGASYNNLGITLEERERIDEAEQAHLEALKIREAALGDSHVDVAESRLNLATVYYRRKQYDKAERMYSQIVDSLDADDSGDEKIVLIARTNLANVYRQTERYDEAVAEFKWTTEAFERVYGPEHPNVASTRSGIASVLHRQEKHAEAEPYFRDAIAIWDETIGAGHPNTLEVRRKLADNVTAQGRGKEALEISRDALRNCQDQCPAKLEAALLLQRAELLWTVGANDEARLQAHELAERARRLQERSEAGMALDSEARRWLAEHPL